LEEAVGHQLLEMLLVEKVLAALALAEEEPVFALRAGREAVRDEAAERRDARAGADHDHRRVRVVWEEEMLLLALDVNRRRLVAAPALGEEGARHAFAYAVANLVFHGRDRQVHLIRVRGERRRDGVEARREAAEQADELLRCELRVGIRMQQLHV